MKLQLSVRRKLNSAGGDDHVPRDRAARPGARCPRDRSRVGIALSRPTRDERGIQIESFVAHSRTVLATIVDTCRRTRSRSRAAARWSRFHGCRRTWYRSTCRPFVQPSASGTGPSAARRSGVAVAGRAQLSSSFMTRARPSIRMSERTKSTRSSSAGSSGSLNRPFPSATPKINDGCGYRRRSPRRSGASRPPATMSTFLSRSVAHQLADHVVGFEQTDNRTRNAGTVVEPVQPHAARNGRGSPRPTRGCRVPTS